MTLGFSPKTWDFSATKEHSILGDHRSFEGNASRHGATAAGRHAELPWSVFAYDNGKKNEFSKRERDTPPHTPKFSSVHGGPSGKMFHQKSKEIKTNPTSLLVILCFIHNLPRVVGRWRMQLNSQRLVSSLLGEGIGETGAKMSRNLAKGT